MARTIMDRVNPQRINSALKNLLSACIPPTDTTQKSEIKDIRGDGTVKVTFIANIPLQFSGKRFFKAKFISYGPTEVRNDVRVTQIYLGDVPMPLRRGILIVHKREKGRRYYFMMPEGGKMKSYRVRVNCYGVTI